jgi:hypothetical protein
MAGSPLLQGRRRSPRDEEGGLTGEAIGRVIQVRGVLRRRHVRANAPSRFPAISAPHRPTSKPRGGCVESGLSSMRETARDVRTGGSGHSSGSVEALEIPSSSVPVTIMRMVGNDRQWRGDRSDPAMGQRCDERPAVQPAPAPLQPALALEVLLYGLPPAWCAPPVSSRCQSLLGRPQHIRVTEEG